jgi:phenylpropionate dioxygenase-like ring-hydroxylating dioxygenase large terminal subunit
MATLPDPDHHPDWARSLSDPEVFAEEQRRLGRFWTFLGVTTDLRKDGDWIRATLGGRSVFVQRFGDTLRGFENVCLHRFYPLRTEDKGNGPVRCGFHHWQYNEEGVAVGIPKCKDMFGVGPREMDVRLAPVEIATCGILVFGRFAGEGETETLEESLGDAFTILSAICNPRRAPRRILTPIAANWKLLYHITLDDYHLVAVHPSTFGKGGYLPTEAPRYYRIGKHSAYFYDGRDGDVERMAEECRQGTYHPGLYRIFQLFPNLLVLHVDAGLSWYVILQQYVPVAHDRSLSRSWFFPVPFAPVDRSWLRGLARKIAEPYVPWVLPFFMRRIFSEDNGVCEGIQTVAGQIGGFPILGRHETRIEWFEEVYENAVRGGSPEAIRGRAHPDRAAVPGGS